MLSVRIERRGGRRREEFSNLAIVVGYTANGGAGRVSPFEK